jgi:tetratricopeptide (TPR) repeat protein
MGIIVFILGMLIILKNRKLNFIAVSMLLVSCVYGQSVFAKSEAENVREVKDLYYGTVLYEFYQNNYYSAAVNLITAQKQKRLEHSDNEARLLLGGLYLSYGLHNEAEEIFQNVIEEGASAPVRDRAWFFLGKIRYHKQLFVEAEAALNRVGKSLDKSLQEEFRTLRSNLLMAQKKYHEAIHSLLNIEKHNTSKHDLDKLDDTNYVRFNLGVALIRAGEEVEGRKLVKQVGVLRTNDANMKALRDKANLALGYSLIKDDPKKAKDYLQLVRLNGPYSNRALLGLGWAEVELEQYEQALVPWQELASRDRNDVAVFESLLAIGNALERLRVYPQAMTTYQNAINQYEKELVYLELTVVAVKSGRLWSDLLSQTSRNEMGWFWEAELLPNTPEARYLPGLMAGHGFHEAIKNLRDLKFLENKLDRWSDEIPAFDYMLELRRKTYESQLNKLNPENTKNHIIDVRTTRDIYATELRSVEANNNYLALATAKEQAHYKRLASAEEKIWRLSSRPEFGPMKSKQYRIRYEFLKGVLDYDVYSTYAIRRWQVTKSLNSLDSVLESTLAQQQALQSSREYAPQRFEGFNQRISDQKIRISQLKNDVHKVFNEQKLRLQEMVDIELDNLRLRLVDYLDQARFSLAHLQDLAINSGKSSLSGDEEE